MRHFYMISVQLSPPSNLSNSPLSGVQEKREMLGADLPPPPRHGSKKAQNMLGLMGLTCFYLMCFKKCFDPTLVER